MSTPSELSSLKNTDWQPCGVGHVAVYGTLQDRGWYPGLVLQGTQAVLAEVYPLDNALEQLLDGYEGIWPQDTGEYTKRIVTVPVALTSGGTQTMAVLVYEALPAAVAQVPVIAAGDWLAWCKQHKQASA